MHSRLAALLPEFSHALRRFPEAALAAFVCAALSCLIVAERFGAGRPITDWLSEAYLAAVATFPALFAIGLACERTAISPGRRLVLSTLAAAFFAMLAIFQYAADLSRPLLICYAALLPPLAAHVRRPRDNVSFWLYNHDLWIGFAMAVIGAGLVAASLAAIFATLSALFQIGIGGTAYAYSNALAVNLAGPLILLTLAPAATRADGVERASIDTQQTSSRAIAVVAKFILVPVLLIYTAIIYFYAAKIAADGVLPQGQIGWMVLLYGAAGTLTLLLVYPTRHSGGILVAFFYRFWFLIALLPVALLFLAVYTRTDQYGVTDKRYLVSLAGVWLVVQALLFGLRNDERRDLRTIIASLEVLIALAMAGPWGAIGSTTRLLAADFGAIAAASPAFKDGAFEADKLDTSTKSRLISILKYLGENGRLDLIYPVIASQPAAKHLDISPAASIEARREQAAKFADFAGLPGYMISHETLNGRVYFTFYSGKPVMLPARGQLAGPFTLASDSANWGQPQIVVTGTDGPSITATLGSGKLTVTGLNGTEWTFDTEAIARSMKDAQSAGAQTSPPLRFTASANGVSADVIVISGSGYTEYGRIAATSLTLWLTWGN